MDVRQKLRARALVATKNPQHAGCDGLGILLLHSTHLDAKVSPLDNDTDPARFDHSIDRHRYFPSHPFLKLKPVGVSVDQARQLAQTYDPAVGNVANVRAPKEGKQMVLTQTEEGDVLHNDHVVVTVEGEEGIAHDRRWIGGIAFGEVSKGFSDPAWGFEQTLAVWILDQLLEKSCNRLRELVIGRQRGSRDAHLRSTSTALFSVSFKRILSNRADGSLPSRRRQIAKATFSVVGRQPSSPATSRFRWRWSTS